MTSAFSQLILFCLYFSVPFFDIKWNVQAKKLETAYTACDINSYLRNSVIIKKKQLNITA